MAGALDAGIVVSDLDRDYPAGREAVFLGAESHEACSDEEGALICVKGASDRVIPACGSQVAGRKTLPLGPRDREAWDRWVEGQAARGMRVLAVAMKRRNGAVTGTTAKRDWNS